MSVLFSEFSVVCASCTELFSGDLFGMYSIRIEDDEDLEVAAPEDSDEFVRRVVPMQPPQSSTTDSAPHLAQVTGISSAVATAVGFFSENGKAVVSAAVSAIGLATDATDRSGDTLKRFRRSSSSNEAGNGIISNAPESESFKRRRPSSGPSLTVSAFDVA